MIVRVASFSTTSTIANSSDGGTTWSPFPGASTITAYGGKVSVSALGDSIVWAGASGFSGIVVSTNGGAFNEVSGLPASAVVTSDKLNNTVFYAASGPNFFISTDGGSTFTQASTLGSATTSTQIASSPFTAGEFFISTDHGVWHSADYGKTFTGLSGATQAWSIAVGKGKSSNGPPALFAAATIDGVNSLYRTDDLSVTWQKLPTVEKALSSASNMVLAADPNVYSQVFVGTNGRGIFVGKAQ